MEEKHDESSMELVEKIIWAKDQAIVRVFAKAGEELRGSIDSLKDSMAKSAKANDRLGWMVLILNVIFGIATLVGTYAVLFKP